MKYRRDCFRCWMAVCAAILLCIGTGVQGRAAASISCQPKPQVEYAYSTGVKCGVIRYISQNPDSKYFRKDYWGSWESQAKKECFTSSISMALSYVAINRTPKDVLDYGKGKTYFAVSWDGISYLKPAFAAAMKNYLEGNGAYSPPIIHLTGGYASGSHYVLVIGQISSGRYLVLDPYNDLTWEIGIAGEKATYQKSGVTCTSAIDISYQYYNSGASVTPKGKQTISASSVKKVYGANKTFSLGAALTKGDGKLTYHSADTSVVTVSSKGVVTVKGVGKTNIVIKAQETAAYQEAAKSVTVTIRPKATKFTVCKNTAAQGISMTWEKRAGISAYQIQYGTEQNFASAVKVKVLPPALSASLQHLKKGSKYYVRIRTYKRVNGTNYCSSWSDVTAVNIK